MIPNEELQLPPAVPDVESEGGTEGWDSDVTTDRAQRRPWVHHHQCPAWAKPANPSKTGTEDWNWGRDSHKNCRWNQGLGLTLCKSLLTVYTDTLSWTGKPVRAGAGHREPSSTDRKELTNGLVNCKTDSKLTRVTAMPQVSPNAMGSLL